jgi:uncharacterized protein
MSARALLAALAVVVSCGSCVLVQRAIEPPFASFESEPHQVPADARVLVFHKTHGYTHDSIPSAVTAVQAAALAAGLAPFSTASGAAFTLDNLAHVDVVVFASANGTVLSPTQEAAFRAWVEQGGTVLLLHGAVGDFDRASPWWWTLIGARFVGHTLLPNVVSTEVRVTPHAVTARLPAAFVVEDEIYAFRDVRVPRHQILLRYEGGPLAWIHDVGKGSVIVNALGHTDVSWEQPEQRMFLEDALVVLSAHRHREPR